MAGRLSLLFEVTRSLDGIELLWNEIRDRMTCLVPTLRHSTLERLRAAVADAVAHAVLDGPTSRQPLRVEVHVEAGRLEARVHDLGTGFSISGADFPSGRAGPGTLTAVRTPQRLAAFGLVPLPAGAPS
jgi:hypothetical protein